MIDISSLKERILAGGALTDSEALSLAEVADNQRRELWDAAAEITAALCGPVFDSCSIINARSGKCSENCKWCAQSAHYKTKADVYPLISREECLHAARYNRDQGIRRFSMVTSGRAMRGADLDRACDYFKELAEEGGIKLCASMGLLGREELEKLFAAGVRRYHCNLEAAPSFFPTLCTTHTLEEKLNTIRIAKEIGMEVCSGGIIGMGESPRQRVELALALKEVEPASIPINILCPIPGTPLENRPPLRPEEVLDTVAFFRFVHPRTALRFAGGRSSLPRESQLEAIRIGMNGGIVGDLLTTIGSTVAEDKRLVGDAGLKF
ncbi:MAG: biotin synthase BioB [[Clostridium] fimetarium]|nr:biotin synthase BioB [Alistipes timonensis]MCM1406121.1 biotin synthase BioB [[Clostridium] fimetarium]